MIIHLYKPLAIHELGQRSNQEDFIYPEDDEAKESDKLFILCDGMGGHEHGEVASKTVSLAMADYLNANIDPDNIANDGLLLEALEMAYLKLDEMDDGADKKMGTTLCLLSFHRGGATVMHIGDSRIYHFRPSENRILYQSKDHSLVYELYQSGEISYEEMQTSPQKNILTRAIQPGIDNRAKPSIVHIADIREDDYFYICSDGMLEQMDNDELCRIICGNGTDEKKRSLLVASTSDNKDNHSAWLIHVKDVEDESSDNQYQYINDEQTSIDNAINLKPKFNMQDVDIVSPQLEKRPNVRMTDNLSRRKTFPKVLIVVLSAIIVFAFGYFVLHDNKEKNDDRSQRVESEMKSDIKPVKEGVKMKTISRPAKKHEPLKEATPKTEQDIDKPSKEQGSENKKTDETV